MKRPRLLVTIGLVLAIALAVLGGVAAARPSSGSPSRTQASVDGQTVRAKIAQGAPSRPSSLPSGSTRLYGTGIDILPAPADAKAYVSAATAGRVTTPELPRGIALGSPTAQLRLVSDGDFGFSPEPGTTLDHRYTRRLAWVLTYHHPPVFVSGPLLVGVPQPPPAIKTCDLIALVDADTGRLLDQLQACRPESAPR